MLLILISQCGSLLAQWSVKVLLELQEMMQLSAISWTRHSLAFHLQSDLNPPAIRALSTEKLSPGAAPTLGDPRGEHDFTSIVYDFHNTKTLMIVQPHHSCGAATPAHTMANPGAPTVP